MARVINIEVLRIRKVQHTAILFAVCSLAILFLLSTLPSTQAQYISNDESRHVFVFSDSKDVRISVTETWNPNDGLNIFAGSTMVKQPVINNQKGECYMRAIVRITDDNGRILNPALETDKKRIDLIMGTLYSDPNNQIDASKSYTTEQLKNLKGVHQTYNEAAFLAPKYNAVMQAYTLEHNGIFGKGAQVNLFDKVVVPTDYADEDITLMDDYKVIVWAQAIQTGSFDNQQSAMNALSDQSNVNNVDGQI